MFSIAITKNGNVTFDIDVRAFALIALCGKRVITTIQGEGMTPDDERVLIQSMESAKNDLMESSDKEAFSCLDENNSSKIDKLRELGKELNLPPEYIEAGIRLFSEGDK